MNDEQLHQLDREQERRDESAEFHRHHPEFALLGDLHPVLRQAFVPLVVKKSRQYHEDGAAPASDQVFVFGSNLSGYHGGGAARAAHKFYGAEWGVAEGRTGRCYAIPTVREHIAGQLGLDDIAASVARFIAHATTKPQDKFLVTRVGCGLAGHQDEDIAPMFAGAPDNCSLPSQWANYVEMI